MDVGIYLLTFFWRLIMNTFLKFKQQLRKAAAQGFTLIELIVTVALVAILATVAITQFDTFKVMAYRGESAQSLGTIAKLQEVYRTSKDTYYDPGAGKALASSAEAYAARTTTAGSCSNSSHTTQSACTTAGATWTPAGTSVACDGNPLGFRLKGCGSETRFRYYLSHHETNGYIAVANAPTATYMSLDCTVGTETETGAGSGTTYANNNSADIDIDGDTHLITDVRSKIIHTNDILSDCD